MDPPQMSTAAQLMHEQIWPEIEAMMWNDAHFRMVDRARQLTGKFNGPTAKLLQDGYLTLQMVAIRRLCDKRTDVYSLCGALTESEKECPDLKPQIDHLLKSLNVCDHVCEQVNKHIAHAANPAKSRNFVEWDMGMKHLEDAHKAICRAAITLERDILHTYSRIEIIPVPQYDFLQDLRLWVPEEFIDKLIQFWHSHRKEVNSWMRQPIG
jgi:hypothetical protein